VGEITQSPRANVGRSIHVGRRNTGSEGEVVNSEIAECGIVVVGQPDMETDEWVTAGSPTTSSARVGTPQSPSHRDSPSDPNHHPRSSGPRACPRYRPEPHTPNKSPTIMPDRAGTTDLSASSAPSTRPSKTLPSGPLLSSVKFYQGIKATGSMSRSCSHPRGT